jgi:hypothetical protein
MDMSENYENENENESETKHNSFWLNVMIVVFTIATIFTFIYSLGMQVKRSNQIQKMYLEHMEKGKGEFFGETGSIKVTAMHKVGKYTIYNVTETKRYGVIIF